MKDSSLEGVAQFGGTHYKGMAIEPAEFIHKNGIGFLAGEAIVYLARHHVKNGPEDLLKAIHFSCMLLSMQYGINIKVEDFLYIVAAAHTENEQAAATVAKVTAQLGPIAPIVFTSGPGPLYTLTQAVQRAIVAVQGVGLESTAAELSAAVDGFIGAFPNLSNPPCPPPTSQEPASSSTNV